MIIEKFNRFELYKLASEQIKESRLFLENYTDELINLFSDSSKIIAKIEDNIDVYIDNNLNNYDKANQFIKILNQNLSNIQNSELKYNITAQNEIREMDANKGITPLSYNDSFYDLLKIIIKEQNKMISRFYLIEIAKNQLNVYQQLPKVFLSHAYDDKGLTLALFFYFLNKGAFLYIDWMWNDEKESDELKAILHNELTSSNQLLFLRTPTSELKLNSYTTIRQWCAWEIGNYYTIKKDEKYILSLYTSSIKNKMLNTFRIMEKVENGIIIGKNF